MGNRATITFAPFDEKAPCIYIHWNGGRASVEAFCKASRELGYCSPAEDKAYGLARLTGLLCAFNGITSDTGVGLGFVEELIEAGDDNGCYVIGSDWEIVERRYCTGGLMDMSQDTLEYEVDSLAAGLVEDIRAAEAAIEDSRKQRRERELAASGVSE